MFFMFSFYILSGSEAFPAVFTDLKEEMQLVFKSRYMFT